MPPLRLLALACALTAPPLAAQGLERAVALHREGRLAEAVEAYRGVAAGATDPATVATARSNACAALNDLGRFREALADCREAERLRRAAGGGPPLADTLNNLGLALDSLGSTPEAEAAYREALDLYRAAGSREDQALVLSNLTSLAIGRGDLGAALAWLDATERLARAATGEPWVEEELRVAHVNRAVALERLGAYREALAEVRAGAGLGAGDPLRAATRTIDVAVLYRNLGDPWRALAELDGAEAELAGVDDRSTRATIALNRGLVRLLNLDDPAAAATDFRAALALARAAGDRREEGRSLCALARAQLVAGDEEAAAASYRAGLEVAVASESAETRWTALAGLGAAAAAAGRDGEALDRLQEAIAELEGVGAGVASAGLREGLVTDQRALYAGAVDLLARRAAAGDGAAGGEALALAERARARELLDALAGDRAAAPLDAGALIALGRERGPLLAFFAGASRLWRFRLDDSGLAVADVGAAEAILDDARQAAAAFAARRAPDTAQLARLARLGRALLAGLPAAGPRFTIVPDGALFHLPFELLTAPADGRRLLETTAVAYAPSLSVLARLPRGERAARWRLAVLADPEPGTAGSSPAGEAGLLAARFGLPPLPGARREARAAAERIGEPAAVGLGTAASEAALRLRAHEGARLLLVAAHTLVDERLDGGAAIFLAPGGGEDGVLSPAELAALPITVDLAVLSGCRTALAGGRDGRSLATLSGALLGAGARGVVATLWEVPDRAAEALMDGFTWELGRGTAPAEALRRAKLRLAGDPRWRDRLDWAAYVLIGDPPPLAPHRHPWLWAAAATALAAAFALARLTTHRAD